MTGGSSYRAEVGADAVFERLSRELSGFYRLGVEKDASRRRRQGAADESAGRADRRARYGRAKSSTCAPTRIATGRRGSSSALEAPIPATARRRCGSPAISPPIPDDPSRVKIVLSGEASRLDPGEATVQLLVRDLEGTKLLAGEQPIGEPRGDGLAFTAERAGGAGRLRPARRGHRRRRPRRVGRSSDRRAPAVARHRDGERSRAAARAGAGPGRAAPGARHGEAGRAAGRADRSRRRADRRCRTPRSMFEIATTGGRPVAGPRSGDHRQNCARAR